MARPKLAFMVAATFIGSIMASSATAPALGQPPVVVKGHTFYDPENQRVVWYGDLNLASVSEQQKLLHRVRYAVNDLCDRDPTWIKDIDRPCSKAAWDTANPQIASVVQMARAGGNVSTAAAISIVAGR
jgi:UrcA family protein